MERLSLQLWELDKSTQHACSDVTSPRLNEKHCSRLAFQTSHHRYRSKGIYTPQNQINSETAETLPNPRKHAAFPLSVVTSVLFSKSCRHRRRLRWRRTPSFGKIVLQTRPTTAAICLSWFLYVSEFPITGRAGGSLLTSRPSSTRCRHARKLREHGDVQQGADNRKRSGERLQ